MKHITKVSVMKAQATPVCDLEDPFGIARGLEGIDPLGCIASLILQAVEGDKNKGGEPAA